MSKTCIKGSANIESIVDLADIDEIAITPEGMFEPMVKYCSGDLLRKIAELTTAINNTDDEKLQTKFRKQIDRMNALIPRVPVEDITFGLQNKWFSKKFILDFLRQNGYPKAQFGKMVEIEKEDWDGEIRTVKEFVDDPEIEGGQFYILGYGNKSQTNTLCNCKNISMATILGPIQPKRQPNIGEIQNCLRKTLMPG